MTSTEKDKLTFPKLGKIFSESVAYNWTKGIYLNAGASYFNAYLEILKFQWLNGFMNTGGYPTFYGGWQK